MSARQAARLVATSLGLLLILDASGMVHAGEGMPAGRTRSLVLAVGRPVDRVTSATGLDGLTRALASTFGHEAPTDSSSGLSVVERPAASGTSGTSGTSDAADAPGGISPQPSGTAPAPAPSLRVPTAPDPLRLLVTGDSLTDGLGPTIAAGSEGAVHTDSDTRSGTGLVRPDFFDWATHAREQMANRDPEAVTVTLGGNDGQEITMPDGRVLPTGSPEWLAEYRRRTIVVMQIWSGGGRRQVYWMSLPPAREPKLNGFYHQISGVAADAAQQVPGVHFVNVSDRLSKNGAYSSYLTDDRGKTVLARTTDGVHLTLDGARIASDIFLAQINADWHMIR
ncbi:DUF459 domain-containing protein [Frankia sp. Cppng1_Ct_nod]|uniref:SGNH/GDSL hydrolase family protein n=1 Tax=Frankia sp. Cppng1_Ct_nod TaxID=2897162 RepID=UPI001041A9D4|nr:DUF459 domain-containing protein [Frankia sp. Cppng1_Ct_nod]